MTPAAAWQSAQGLAGRRARDVHGAVRADVGRFLGLAADLEIAEG